MLRKLGRLFTIKTRFEAWLVIYAIAVGAVERGQHYLTVYHGWSGWTLALACTGVVFLAGGKLLDSVRRPEAVVIAAPAPARRHAFIGRSRPRRLPTGRVAESRISRHRD